MPETARGPGPYRPLVGAAPNRPVPGPRALVAGLAALTLAGGVAAAVDFPRLPPKTVRAVPVAQLVPTKIPLRDGNAVAQRILPPGGSWKGVDGAATSQAFVSGSATFGADGSFYDDNGRQLVVVVEKRPGTAVDADAKEFVNGPHFVALTRHDDGVWSSHYEDGVSPYFEAAGIRGGFLVGAFVVGEPTTDDAEVLTVVRAQLASMDDVDTAAGQAAVAPPAAT